jgi:signal transduction histidine kinase
MVDARDGGFAVSERHLKSMIVAVVAAALLVIAGLGVTLSVIGRRHDRSIADQAHEVAVLRYTSEAQTILAAQGDSVMASPEVPLDRSQLEAREEQFRRIIANPDLVRTAAGRQLQERILAADRAFMAAARALPSRPSVAQALAVDALGDQVSNLVNELAMLRSAGLSAIVATEQQQRELTAGIIVSFTVALLVIGAASLVLVGRLGEQRARARALEATDHLRNELVSFAAHELRNPATTINAGVYLLRRPDTDPQTRAQALDSMAESAAALGRLVMNLLNMGRVEEGKLHLHRERVAVRQLAKEAVEEMSTYYRGLRERVEADLPDADVDVDRDYLRLVLSNVLSNAVKYAPAESRISVTGEVEGPMAAVHIHDEGPGIPEELRPRVFEKYETAGNDGAGGARGLGLGLYMARLLVEAHGGRIWADGEPGQGTTISFTLPLAAP